jgi:hypothetical protein
MEIPENPYPGPSNEHSHCILVGGSQKVRKDERVIQALEEMVKGF